MTGSQEAPHTFTWFGDSNMVSFFFSFFLSFSFLIRIKWSDWKGSRAFKQKPQEVTSVIWMELFLPRGRSRNKSHFTPWDLNRVKLAWFLFCGLLCLVLSVQPGIQERYKFLCWWDLENRPVSMTTLQPDWCVVFQCYLYSHVSVTVHHNIEVVVI